MANGRWYLWMVKHRWRQIPNTGYVLSKTGVIVDARAVDADTCSVLYAHNLSEGDLVGLIAEEVIATRQPSHCHQRHGEIDRKVSQILQRRLQRTKKW